MVWAALTIPHGQGVAQSQTALDPDEFAWLDEFTGTTPWQTRPDWVSNPSPAPSATANDGVVCFRVDEPGRGMKWSRSLPRVSLAEAPWLVMRYRAQNLAQQREDYLIYLQDGNPRRELGPVKGRDLSTDGQWHVLAVEVSALTDRPSVDLLAIQVQATPAGQARLWVDWIGLSDAPPGGASILRRASLSPARPDWIAPLARAAWVAQPSWLGNPAALGQHRAAVEGGVTRLRVATPNHGMKWSWALPVPALLEGQRYVALRYRAREMSPRGHYALCFMGGTRSKGSDYQVVIAPSELIADGRWHTAWSDLGPLAAQFTNVTGLACEVQAGNAAAELDLQEIRLTQALPLAPLSDFCVWRAGADFTEYEAVSLEASAGADGERWLQRLRMTDWPQTNQITAEGIPFALSQGAFRVAATSLPGKTDLRLPVGRRVSEVFLLMLAKFRGEEEPPYGEGRFKAIRDVDRFRVRLEYADGTADECLPLEAASREFGVIQSAQVLVAAADAAKMLREVVVLDRTRQASFAVAALTARARGQRRFPEAYAEPPPLAQKPRGPQSLPAARLELSGTSLHVTRGACGALIEFGGQPRWRQLQDLTTGWSLLSSTNALLEMTVDGKAIPQADYVTKNISLPKRGNGLGGACVAQYAIEGVPGITVSLTVEPEGSHGLALRVAVANEGGPARRVALTAPRIGPYRLCADADAAWHLLPKRGAVFDNRACAYRERYCGLFPLQFMDTFAPAEARGLSLRTEDTNCAWKHYVLEKDGAAYVLAVDYAEQVLSPGQRFETPRAILSLTDGSWQRGFEAYRDWVRSWYQPLSPRLPWFREVFNFRQRFLHGLDPLDNGQRLDLQRAVDEARREFGGVEYLHLFDWGDCGPYGRIYGRTGDHSPYDYLKGGQAALREALASVQAQGIPVGLYVEGYLLDERGKLGQRFGKEWQMTDAAGHGARWPDSTETYVWVFFNGEALWLEGPATEWFEPETRAAIRHCHQLLRQHRDAFTTDHPTPLVPTLRGGVVANAFPAPGKTLYTLYNSGSRTVRGDLLEVPWEEGITCEDAWQGKPASLRHVGGTAVLGSELGPNDVGCLVVRKVNRTPN